MIRELGGSVIEKDEWDPRFFHIFGHCFGNLLVMLYSFGFYFFLVKITLLILFIRVTHVVAHVDGKKESMSEKVIFLSV